MQYLNKTQLEKKQESRRFEAIESSLFLSKKYMSNIHQTCWKQNQIYDCCKVMLLLYADLVVFVFLEQAQSRCIFFGAELSYLSLALLSPPTKE